MDPRGGREIIECTVIRGSRGFPGFLGVAIILSGDLLFFCAGGVVGCRGLCAMVRVRSDLEYSSSVRGEGTRWALFHGGGRCAGLSVALL